MPIVQSYVPKSDGWINNSTDITKGTAKTAVGKVTSADVQPLDLASLDLASVKPEQITPEMISGMSVDSSRLLDLYGQTASANEARTSDWIKSQAESLSDVFVGRGLHESGWKQEAFTDMFKTGTRELATANQAAALNVWQAQAGVDLAAQQSNQAASLQAQISNQNTATDIYSTNIGTVLDVYNSNQQWISQQLDRDQRAQELLAQIKIAKMNNDSQKESALWGALGSIAGGFLAGKKK